MDSNEDARQALLDQIDDLRATVTQQQERIAVLEQSELTLEVLRTSMPDLMFVHDDKRRYVDLLAPSDDLLFPSAGEIRGRLLHEVFPQEDADKFKELLDRAVSSGRTETLEYSLQVPVGLRSFEAACKATSTSEGVAFTVTTVRDVTEKKRLEAEVDQAHKMEIVGRLAGGLAHDFNNLLTGIMGSAQLAQMELPDDHPSSMEMEEIVTSCDRASRLTHKLLAFGRKSIVETTLLDVNQRVIGLQNLLARLMLEDVAISYELGSDLGQILADPTHIEQVIINLAVNARDAMPNGGRLHIVTKRCVVGPQQRPNGAGEYVQLTVSDTGVGISPGDQDTVFEPFYTTKAGTGGSGLGLSTVYGIVKQSGGFLTLDSQVGAGATFHVYLPFSADQTAAQRQAPRPNTTPTRGAETLLFIEDDPSILNTYRAILESQGYRVLPASCAAEALSQYAQHEGSIDLVLSDVVLPGKSGPEIVDELDLPAECPVLYVSGQFEDQIENRRRKDRPLQFLAKPFSREQLLAKIRSVLSER